MRAHRVHRRPVRTRSFLSVSKSIGLALALVLIGHAGASNATVACRKIQEDMSSGEECLMPPSALQTVYSDLVSHRLVRDSSCLLRALPLASTTVKGCRMSSGLLRIRYVITGESVEIDMEYAGGISTIELERKADGVRRRITYSAD
jgi:hypothetical protein